MENSSEGSLAANRNFSQATRNNESIQAGGSQSGSARTKRRYHPRTSGTSASRPTPGNPDIIDHHKHVCRASTQNRHINHGRSPAKTKNTGPILPAARAVSAASRRLPASRNSFDQE
jgi:hypothetical protein